MPVALVLNSVPLGNPDESVQLLTYKHRNWIFPRSFWIPPYVCLVGSGINKEQPNHGTYPDTVRRGFEGLANDLVKQVNACATL